MDLVPLATLDMQLTALHAKSVRHLMTETLTVKDLSLTMSVPNVVTVTTSMVLENVKKLALNVKNTTHWMEHVLHVTLDLLYLEEIASNLINRLPTNTVRYGMDLSVSNVLLARSSQMEDVLLPILSAELSTL